jgi:DNA-binding winged helix-turn-helix (wHTH) protein
MPAVDHSLVEECASLLRPADARTLRVLAEFFDRFVSGEELALRMWPEREWERSKATLQLSIHQLRHRFGMEVIQRRGSDYSLIRTALEAGLMRLKFDPSVVHQDVNTKPPMVFSVRDVLDRADQTQTGLVWGPAALDQLLNSISTLADVIGSPYPLQLRLAFRSSDIRPAVFLLAKLEATLGIGTEDLCKLCQGRFQLLATSALLFGSGKFIRLIDSTTSVEHYNSDGTLLVDRVGAERYALALMGRWEKFALLQQIVVFDVVGEERDLARHALESAYRNLHQEVQPPPELWSGP